ncbi:MAG TPA: M6 family metalloprotease domain-containing protein [Candidatus Krumholzibacteria bacterium]
MRRVLTSLTLVFCAFAAPAMAQVVSPAPGTEMPAEVKQSIEGKGKFQFKHAWLDKAEKAREEREQYIQERGFYKGDMLQAAQRQRYAVTGNFAIPVFCVKYSDTGADPFPISQLQTKLFNGPFAPQTVTQFYNEISYGDLNLSGTVYGWTTLPQTNLYYTGSGTCNGLCGTAHMRALITSTLAANDGAVNFGQYDNDGPDGIPNSGDDDGVVDFVSFVHPEQGAECGVNGNIWSHRYVVSAYSPFTPYTTNDARTGGGFIVVDDYTVQPIYNCGGVSLIDIGVFAHEWGHAFGLPDLYDTNGGSQGVGHWCLMGSGNWNTPTNPSHMSAWSKDQLGWANVIAAPAAPTPFTLYAVETNRDVVRLDVTHEKWRRLNTCAIQGSYSLHCGLTAAEATARSWASGEGYGNYWKTTVSRDFEYNGSGSVQLQYQYSFSLEPSYDYVDAQITVNGTTSTFATYNAVGAGTQVVDLTPYLGGAGPYKVSFKMTSDTAYSDEDGSYATTCGAVSLDDIYVVGGGENYHTDFEAREDGWAEEMNPPTEYFLVENRKPLGSDVNVWGGGGLSIWHVDSADQTGGPINLRPRGIAVEQADGLGNLESNANRGDAGDPYPGTTSNFNFNAGTNPNSNGHDGPSTVSVQLTSGNGNPMTATMKGGWPAPAPATVAPNNGTSGNSVQLQIDGSLFAKTGDVELVGPGNISATNVEWVGKDRILADFDLTGAPNGTYDVVVYNPGGASAALTDAFAISGGATAAGDSPKKFALLPNYPNPFNPATTIRYELASRSRVELRIYDVKGALVKTLVNESKPAGVYSLEWNGRDDRGVAVSSGVYFYRITAGSFNDVRKMTLLK